MMPRSLLMVGLVALVIALAATGALSVLRADEVVEVFPLPADILDLPLPTEPAPGTTTAAPQATAVPTANPTSTPGSAGEALPPATAVLQAGQNGYNGCVDTYIQFYLPADNYCDSPELHLATSNKAATLLRFDLTNLPEQITGLNSEATILQATLELYAVQGHKGVLVGLYCPQQPWDPCAVTWNTPWEQAGADGPADRDNEPSVEATVEQAEGWMAFDVTGLVQYWLHDPAQNHGLIIKSLDVSAPSHYILHSSDHPEAGTRPRLTIHYVPAAPSATPISELTPTVTAIPGETLTAVPAATTEPALTPTVIRPISPRVVELHWRNEMDVGSPYRIQAIFRPETAGMTSAPAGLYKLRVRAQVTAPTFDIVENSPAEQILEQPEDTLAWTWQVEPRVIGSQTLSLDLLFNWTPASSVSSSITLDRGTWYQTKTIKITRPFPYWRQVTLARNGLLLAGLACIVGWYVLRRRTKVRSLGGS